MLKPLSFAAVAILGSSAVSLAQQLDAAPLNQAVDTYMGAISSIAKDVGTTTDAPGTAKLLERWATANEEFAKSAETFSAKNPAVFGMKEPPPELAASVQRMKNMQQEFPDLGTKVGELVRKFSTEQAVRDGVAKLQASLLSVQKATKRPAKP